MVDINDIVWATTVFSFASSCLIDGPHSKSECCLAFIRNLQQRYSTGLTQNRPIHKKRCRISPSPGRALADPHSKSAITEKLFDRTLFSVRCIQQKHPGNVKHLCRSRTYELNGGERGKKEGRGGGAGC